MTRNAASDYDKTIVHFSDEAGPSARLPFTPVAVGGAPALPSPVPPPSGGAYAPGLNPLVDASSSLLLELVRVGNGDADSLDAMRLRLEAELRAFSAQIRTSGVSEGQGTAARYLLCTALDEAIVASGVPGAQSEWPHRSLLSGFHNETWGGERFFQVLDRVMQQPASNLYLLELTYILLSLGFMGKYRLEDKGFLALETLRDQVYKQIAALRGNTRDDAFTHSAAGRQAPKIHSHIPLWLTGCVALFCFGVSFWGFSHALEARSAPLLAQFAALAPKGTPVPAPKRAAPQVQDSLPETASVQETAPQEAAQPPADPQKPGQEVR